MYNQIDVAEYLCHKHKRKTKLKYIHNYCKTAILSVIFLLLFTYKML